MDQQIAYFAQNKGGKMRTKPRKPVITLDDLQYREDRDSCIPDAEKAANSKHGTIYKPRTKEAVQAEIITGGKLYKSIIAADKTSWVNSRKRTSGEFTPRTPTQVADDLSDAAYTDIIRRAREAWEDGWNRTYFRSMNALYNKRFAK